MNAQTIRLPFFSGKATGLLLVIVGPVEATPAGLIVFAAAWFLKDTVSRAGDLLEPAR